MKVAELKKFLENCPDDAHVRIRDGEVVTHADKISLVTEQFDFDPEAKDIDKIWHILYIGTWETQ